jgi:Zn-dependent M28 family amino/carboxypeptidase
VEKIKIDPANLDPPEELEARLRFFASIPPSVQDELRKRREALGIKRTRFLLDEGVLAVLQDDRRARDGIDFAEAAGSYDPKNPAAPPTFVVTSEQYNRIVRLLENKTPVQMQVNLKARISDTAADAYNLSAEIPGGSKKDQIVMVGAHFDSWHTGTGATDNAAGSAVMMEVVRILKALDLKMDRTVRIALWSGEEEGLLGSKAYVKEHFGDPRTMKLTAAHAKLSGYFNLDNGSGKIRGVYLQGNDAMRPLFEQWLEPFRDLGVSTITIRNTSGTDHLSYDAVGLPGFQFIQDPLDYMTVTHHSSMDTYDHAVPGDLMQAAAVIASVVYDAAMRPDMLPRKALPKPEEVTSTR